jgi:serine/threonine protein kinase
MHDAYINQHRDTIYLVMDYVEGFTIKNYIKYYRLKHRDQKHLSAGGLPEALCLDLIK